MFVNIIDDTDGTTVYNIPTPVIVTPNNNLASSLADSISNSDPNCQFLVELNSGNLNVVSKNVIALTTVFNIQSNSPTSSTQSVNTTQVDQVNNQMATLREFLVAKVNNLSVSDISSIKVISSALSAATQSSNQVSSNTAVNTNLRI